MEDPKWKMETQMESSSSFYYFILRSFVGLFPTVSVCVIASTSSSSSFSSFPRAVLLLPLRTTTPMLMMVMAM